MGPTYEREEIAHGKRSGGPRVRVDMAGPRMQSCLQELPLECLASGLNVHTGDLLILREGYASCSVHLGAGGVCAAGSPGQELSSAARASSQARGQCPVSTSCAANFLKKDLESVRRKHFQDTTGEPRLVPITFDVAGLGPERDEGARRAHGPSDMGEVPGAGGEAEIGLAKRDESNWRRWPRPRPWKARPEGAAL